MQSNLRYTVFNFLEIRGISFWYLLSTYYIIYFNALFPIRWIWFKPQISYTSNSICIHFSNQNFMIWHLMCFLINPRKFQSDLSFHVWPLIYFQGNHESLFQLIFPLWIHVTILFFAMKAINVVNITFLEFLRRLIREIWV